MLGFLMVAVLSVALPDQTYTGVPFNYTITSSDPSYTGTVHVTSSDTNSPSFPFDYTFVPADNGTHTFSATMATAGRGFDTQNQNVTATDVANPSITGTDVMIVKWNPSLVRGFTFDHPATVNIHEPFNVTVYARNADGNIVSSFTGTVHFRVTPGLTSLPDYTFTSADSGQHTFSLTASMAGSMGMTAELLSDPSTGYSTSFEVVCPDFSVTAGNTGPMCPGGGDPTVHLYANATGPGPIRYMWQANINKYYWVSDEQNPTPPLPGSYGVAAINSDQCVATALTTVAAKPAPAPATTSSTTTLCGGTVTVSLSDPSSYSNYVWSINQAGAPGTIVSGQGTPSVVVSPGASSGVLIVDVSATYTPSGCSTVGEAGITLHPPLSTHITAQPSACAGTTLTASTDYIAGAQYYWNLTHAQILANHGSTIDFKPTGDGDVDISLSVTSGGCEAADSAHVTITTSAAITQQPESQTVQPGTQVTLTVAASGSVQSYNWYEGTSGDRRIIAGTGPSLTTPPLDHSTSFWAEAVTSCGNAQSDTAFITVSSEPASERRRAVRH